MSERKPRCSAQRLVSIALPSVLRERSKSTQQRTQRSNSGLRREIAVELVARYAPLFRSRLPRPDANNSIASAMREAPPVNATMPSASRLSVTSSAGTCRTNQRNPSPIDSAANAQSVSVDQPRRRSNGSGTDRSVEPGIPGDSVIAMASNRRHLFSTRRDHSAIFGGLAAMLPATWLMNRFDRTVDRMARGRGGDEGDQADLRQNRQVAKHPDRRHAEQSRQLVAPRRADEGTARELDEHEQRNGAAATDQSPLQSQLQKMSLEMRCDETVLGADEMQHFDHRAIGRNSGAGGEGDGEHGGGKDEQEHAHAEGNDRSRHGAHTVDKAAMVVKAHARDLLAERLAQLREIGRRAGRAPNDDEARDR